MTTISYRDLASAALAGPPSFAKHIRTGRPVSLRHGNGHGGNLHEMGVVLRPALVATGDVVLRVDFAFARALSGSTHIGNLVTADSPAEYVACDARDRATHRWFSYYEPIELLRMLLRAYQQDTREGRDYFTDLDRLPR